MNNPKTIVIRGSQFTLDRSVGVGAATAKYLNVIDQCIYRGKRGSPCLVQFFTNGTGRAIFWGGRTEILIPGASYMEAVPTQEEIEGA